MKRLFIPLGVLVLLVLSGFPLVANQVVYHKVELEMTDEKPLLRVARAIEISDARGSALGRIVIRESARVRMKNFSGTLFDGSRRDPAGKANLQKQGSYNRFGVDGHETWVVLVPGLRAGTRYEYSYELEIESPDYLPTVDFGSAFAVKQAVFSIVRNSGQQVDFALFNPEQINYRISEEQREGQEIWSMRIADRDRAYQP